jgi:hypothetical protein
MTPQQLVDEFRAMNWLDQIAFIRQLISCGQSVDVTAAVSDDLGLLEGLRDGDFHIACETCPYAGDWNDDDTEGITAQ